VLSQLTACYTYRPLRGTVEQRVGEEHIHVARVTLRNGTVLSLRDVTVRSDSVIGFTDDGRERRAIPAGEVAWIEQREVSVLQTGALLLATAAVAYVAIVIAALSRLGPNWTAVPSRGVSAR
jgi:hypothetical protein